MNVKKIFTQEKDISVDVTYDRIVNENLWLSYSAGMGVDLMMDGLKRLVPQLKNTDLFELLDGNRLVVYLNKIEKAHEALQYVEVHNVEFCGQEVVVDFSMK